MKCFSPSKNEFQRYLWKSYGALLGSAKKKKKDPGVNLYSWDSTNTQKINQFEINNGFLTGNVKRTGFISIATVAEDHG